MGAVTYAISIIVLILGLTVVIFPRQCTKKEVRSEESVVKKNRAMGAVIALIGAMMLVVNLLFIR